MMTKIASKAAVFGFLAPRLIPARLTKFMPKTQAACRLQQDKRVKRHKDPPDPDLERRGCRLRPGRPTGRPRYSAGRLGHTAPRPYPAAIVILVS